MKKISVVTIDVTNPDAFQAEDKPYIVAIKNIYYFSTTDNKHLCRGESSITLHYALTWPDLTDNAPVDVLDRIRTRYCEPEPNDICMPYTQVLNLEPTVCGSVCECADEDTVLGYVIEHC